MDIVYIGKCRYKIQEQNKKFWEELICLISLHKLTVDNIQCHHPHTKVIQIHQSVQKLLRGFFAPTSEL
jgi:hypothetical protein